MRHIKTITISLLSLALFISACSSGLEKEKENNSMKIVVESCSSDSLTKIESGDILTAEDANTSVQLTYNEDESKSVCAIFGTAYLLR